MDLTQDKHYSRAEDPMQRSTITMNYDFVRTIKKICSRMSSVCMWNRSYCVKMKHILEWKARMPLFNFFFHLQSHIFPTFLGVYGYHSKQSFIFSDSVQPIFELLVIFKVLIHKVDSPLKRMNHRRRKLSLVNMVEEEITPNQELTANFCQTLPYVVTYYHALFRALSWPFWNPKLGPNW